jgi:hypothetical protein
MQCRYKAELAASGVWRRRPLVRPEKQVKIKTMIGKQSLATLTNFNVFNCGIVVHIDDVYIHSFFNKYGKFKRHA